MAWFCSYGCGERRPAGGLKDPCRKCGERTAERIPPLDGWIECSTDDAPTDEEAKQSVDKYFANKREQGYHYSQSQMRG